VIVSIECAAALLARGEIVAYPTETVYGLAADASSARAVAALESLKGREAGRGMSVLLADAAELAHWVQPLPPRARELAARFWPGPLTLVLGGFDPRLAPVATPNGVGFRCSPHPIALALARAARCPLLSTSCNPSGERPARSAGEVRAYFGPSLAVAGGDPTGDLSPSTVLAIAADGSHAVLREGAIALAVLLNGAAEGSPG
jgi:L-threonylcarbamoyladenylate synthase